MTPLRDSMVDVQSPQQALRAYSSAKEYAYGILCDACDGESNIRRLHTRGPPGELRTSPVPGPPQGQHRDGQASERLAPHTRYRLVAPTPRCDESHVGHDLISTLRDTGMPRSATLLRCSLSVTESRSRCGARIGRRSLLRHGHRPPAARAHPGPFQMRTDICFPGEAHSAVHLKTVAGSAHGRLVGEQPGRRDVDRVGGVTAAA